MYRNYNWDCPGIATYKFIHRIGSKVMKFIRGSIVHKIETVLIGEQTSVIFMHTFQCLFTACNYNESLKNGYPRRFNVILCAF